jgi:hypothetical protein
MKIQIAKTLTQPETEKLSETSDFIRNYAESLTEQGLSFEVAKLSDIVILKSPK